jgi:hypothetical protein
MTPSKASFINFAASTAFFVYVSKAHKRFAFLVRDDESPICQIVETALALHFTNLIFHRLPNSYRQQSIFLCKLLLAVERQRYEHNLRILRLPVG